MRILLTGESGFLGGILANALKGMGHSVLGLNTSGKRVDITRPFILEEHLLPDTIIHVAGKAHTIPGNKEEADRFYEVNLEGTKHLCNAVLQHHKPAAFIFISTVSVYGMDKGIGIKESALLNGSTPYAKSKIMAEEFLSAWAAKHNIQLGILRLPLIAGPNPPGNLGAMIHGIRTGKYLSIGDASGRKSMLWAADIADIVPVLAEKGGIYNLTDGYAPSFGELEKVISQSLSRKLPFKIPLPVAKLLAMAGDIFGSRAPINSNKLTKITSSLTFDDTRAQTVLGWKPSKVLEKLPEII